MNGLGIAGCASNSFIARYKVENFKPTYEKSLKIFPETPKGPAWDIGEILLVGISLPFKTNAAVGFIGVSVLYEPYEIFEKVPHEKEDHKQLYLLFEMNTLMVHEDRIFLELFSLHHNEWPQDHSIKLFGKNKFIYHHEHKGKIRKCYFCNMSFFRKKIPLEEGDYYLTPEGYRCFTEQYHLKRGYCCQSGCRHCPYGFNKKTNQQKK